MAPMIDAAVPGMTFTILTIGPAAIGTLIGLVGGLAWLVRGTRDELRLMAAADGAGCPERRVADSGRLAA
jgi:hypothetical protein